MRLPFRLSIGAATLAVLAACSGTSDQPALSEDLRQDLAKAGGGDVQLTGATMPRLEVVSAAERTGAAPAPRGTAVARVASTRRGKRAVVKSERKEAPVIVESPAARTTAPAQTRRTEMAPQTTNNPGNRPALPQPSTQREPPGGWKSPEQVIRNAPFPINP